MHSMDDTSDESSSDMVFSPDRGRRQSLHQLSTPEVSVTSSARRIHRINSNEPLPMLQDNSWIGAKVSPIHSFDNDVDQEDDQEDFNATAPYRKALHDSIGSSASFGAIQTERTSLLGRGGGGGADDSSSRSSIHPLWDEGNPLVYAREQRYHVHNRRSSSLKWAYGLAIIVPAILFACICIHDAYLWYISVRRGKQLSYDISWKLPWLTPSPRTLLRFGALYPSRILASENDEQQQQQQQQQQQYWRLLSSFFVTTSVVEWMLLIWAWILLRRASYSRALSSTMPSSLVWTILYILSIGTGQLWMIALNENGISGCSSWGTCGILCAMGVSKPNRRFSLFMAAISLVLLDLLQPYGSVFGAIGGSYFGWATFGVFFAPPSDTGKDGMQKKKRSCLTWLATLLIFKLWLVPVIIIFSKKETLL